MKLSQWLPHTHSTVHWHARSFFIQLKMSLWTKGSAMHNILLYFVTIFWYDIFIISGCLLLEAMYSAHHTHIILYIVRPNSGFQRRLTKLILKIVGSYSQNVSPIHHRLLESGFSLLQFYSFIYELCCASIGWHIYIKYIYNNHVLSVLFHFRCNESAGGEICGASWAKYNSAMSRCEWAFTG